MVCDYENLKYFMITKKLNRRQARWAQYLTSFDFDILYRKGSLNPADDPSRRPDYETYAEERDQTILLTLQNKLRFKGLLEDQQSVQKIDAINMSIRFLSIRLATGSNQSRFIPEI